MVLYRSIGHSELTALLLDGHVHGRYKNSTEKQNNSILDLVVCFFKEKYIWSDSEHCFTVAIDVPNKKVKEFGIGTYYAAKNFAKTKIWTGKKGSIEYKLDEAYLKEYSLEDITEIYGLHRYTDKYIQQEIEPILSKYNIVIK